MAGESKTRNRISRGAVVKIVTVPQGEALSGCVQFADEQHIVVACAPEDWRRLALGSDVELSLPTDEGYYQIRTCIIHLKNNCLIVAVTTPRLVQRRRSKRVSCHLPIGYWHDLVTLRAGGAMADARLGIISDISVGGAKMMTDTMLPIHTLTEVEIPLADGTMLKARALILHCFPLHAREKQAYMEMHFQVGLKFLELSRLHQAQLHKFVDHLCAPVGRERRIVVAQPD